jgi:hypothetical protein
MNKSPRILNKKELDKRKKDAYKMLKDEEIFYIDDKKRKLQAQREVNIINEELKKRKNIKEELLLDTNILLNELIDFIKDNTE